MPASDATVVAGLRDDVDATAALVLSVDLCNGDIWVTGPDADPVTAARVRHHVHRSEEPDPFVGGFLIGRHGATTAQREFGRDGWTASAASYQLVLIPLVTVAVSAWLQDEPITPAFAVGSLLVLVGVYIGALRRPST